MDGTRENASDVGVDDGNRLAVGEAGDCSRCVVADARQSEHRRDVVGDLVVVIGGEHPCAFVEAQRTTRIAEFPPGPQDVAGRRGGHRGWHRPASDPFPPRFDDPGDGCLLEHDLADEDLPARKPWLAPWQVALVGVEPAQ
ncbi:Uncharacterised protein [Mycobacteroides abscessus subsp. abscessus]|nr:Uncharacterised protein [Mycobacteroides abscessus subsp. abscessus]